MDKKYLYVGAKIIFINGPIISHGKITSMLYGKDKFVQILINGLKTPYKVGVKSIRIL